MPTDLDIGERVAERYRLEQQLGRSSTSSVWRATDERLGRQVSLRVYRSGLDKDALTEGAATAASLTHPRVVRIFDTGFDSGRFFTVSELLPGSLAWARLPVPPNEALDIGIQVAEALRYAHQRGLAHGHLHRGNVLLAEQGAKVADFGLDPDEGRRPDPSDDLVRLGRLLYLITTEREPDSRSGEGRPLPDEPPGFARVVRALCDGDYRTAEDAVSELRDLRPVEPAAKRRRPRLWISAAIAVLIALAAFGLTQLGDRRTDTDGSTPPPDITGTPVAISTVQDFDPLGDGVEGRSTVAKISDGDPRTFWSTERYSGGPDFSGLKEGVGVILDLGSEQLMGKAQILFPAEGCSFELRYSPTRASDPGDWDEVVTQQDAGTTSGHVFEATASRWWLLWITDLTQGVPGDEGGWSCGVSEVELYAP